RSGSGARPCATRCVRSFPIPMRASCAPASTAKGAARRSRSRSSRGSRRRCMPELPEVETIARGLRALLVGRRIEGAWLSGKPLRMLRPIDRAALLRATRDARVADVRRRAKYLLIDLSTDATLLWHLGMTGQFSLAPAGAPRLEHTHVALAL